MKKTCKLLSVFLVIILLTGCMQNVPKTSSDGSSFASAESTVDISSSLLDNSFSAPSGEIPFTDSDSRSMISASSNNASIISPDSEMPTTMFTPDGEIPAFTLEDFLRVYEDGYLFFRNACIGFFNDADLEEQFMQGENQWVSIKGFSSEQDFINYCDQYFTATFIEKNVIPWFSNGDDAYLREFDEKLYYLVPDGGGIVVPLDTNSVTCEEIFAGKVICTCPDYNPHMNMTMSNGVFVTMVYENGLWLIDNFEYYDE